VIRTSRFLGAALLVLAAAATPIAAAAGGTDPKPAASAKAGPAKDKPADAKTDKDAGPSDAGPGPVDGGELPPGHPPVDDALPPGHPSVGEDGEADPHGAAEPHGARSKFFEPLPDTAEDDASLPPGTMIITIKDAENKPIANAPVVIGILKSSVAQGDSRERRSVDTDAQGTARLDGLPVGGGTSYRVTTTRGPAMYGSAPFALSDKTGKRVTLHAYEATESIDQAAVAMQAFVFVTLREDALRVEHLFRVYNLGKVAWVPSAKAAEVVLPPGYKAFNKPEEMGDVRFEHIDGHGAQLVGTIGPGQHETSFQYQVPLEGSARQSFHLELPPHVGEVRVFAEASKTMGLAVQGFPDAQRQRGRDGRKVMITARQPAQGEREIKTVDITISGLPVPGPGRWIAVAIAVVALGFAIAYTAQLHKEGAVPDDARDDLLEAREALLGEFVALEKARQRGDVGPKAYGRLRGALLDALARIELRLDEVKTARADRRRRGREERKARGEARGAGGAS
jgi:hypothetical protein